MTPITPPDEARSKHQRETATPMGNGTILADCSCGGEYSVTQGGDEYGKLEAAHARHVADDEDDDDPAPLGGMVSDPYDTSMGE